MAAFGKADRPVSTNCGRGSMVNQGVVARFSSVTSKPISSASILAPAKAELDASSKNSCLEIRARE
jgi:hypothetical protein